MTAEIMASEELSTDSGLHFTRDEFQAPSLPDVNSDVKVVDSYDQFLSIIIAIEGKIATIKVYRSRGVGTIVLNNRSGIFMFSYSGAACMTVKKAVQRVMTQALRIENLRSNMAASRFQSAALNHQ